MMKWATTLALAATLALGAPLYAQETPPETTAAMAGDLRTELLNDHLPRGYDAMSDQTAGRFHARIGPPNHGTSEWRPFSIG